MTKQGISEEWREVKERKAIYTFSPKRRCFGRPVTQDWPDNDPWLHSNLRSITDPVPFSTLPIPTTQPTPHTRTLIRCTYMQTIKDIFIPPQMEKGPCSELKTFLFTCVWQAEINHKKSAWCLSTQHKKGNLQTSPFVSLLTRHHLNHTDTKTQIHPHVLAWW